MVAHFSSTPKTPKTTSKSSRLTQNSILWVGSGSGQLLPKPAVCNLVLKPNPIVKNQLVGEVFFSFQEYKILASRVIDDVSEFLHDVIPWTSTIIVHEHCDIGSSKFTRVQESRANARDAKPSVHKIYVEG